MALALQCVRPITHCDFQPSRTKGNDHERNVAISFVLALKQVWRWPLSQSYNQRQPVIKLWQCQKFEMIISQCDCCYDMRRLLTMFCLCLWWAIMAEIIIIMSEFFNYSGFLSVQQFHLFGRSAPCTVQKMQPVCVYKQQGCLVPVFFSKK